MLDLTIHQRFYPLTMFTVLKNAWCSGFLMCKSEICIKTGGWKHDYRETAVQTETECETGRERERSDGQKIRRGGETLKDSSCVE